jgi:hypothetical protein
VRQFVRDGEAEQHDALSVCRGRRCGASQGGGGRRHIDDGADEYVHGDRAGAVTDPAGNHFWIASKVEDVAADELQKRVGEMFKAGGKT